ncbi:MAG: hypothetical protein HY543_01830, partial [Deltaproteobacteria bacterium]|nr:hypothetical protein [Deltaproteobacteria bacterium]
MSARDAANVRHRIVVPAALARWLPLVAIVVAAIALRNILVANTDVSW